VVVANLGAEDVFGERALIDHLPRNLTAIATSETTLAEIDRGLFLFLVDESSTFALGIMRALASRLRDYDELFGDVSRRPEAVTIEPDG
jgi:CRP-like cAMP-binding protein